MPDDRPLREKVRSMAEAGSPHERAVAVAWLEAHPSSLLSAIDILAVDDSMHGPTAEALDAALAAYYERSKRA